MLIYGVPTKIRLFPVNNATECIAVACNTPQLASWSVLNRDGMYYATVAMKGADLPLEVALHGIASESEAHRAVAALTQCPAAFCNS